MRIIKRYSNRRLYDAELSRNVTHADLADMVKRGISLKVIDTTSGKEVTLAVLGRVMLSETSSWKDIKQSKELLNEIISIGGDQSMSILKNTILASIGAFNVSKEKAEKIIDDLIKRGEVDKSSRKKAVMELLAKAERSTVGLGKKVEKEINHEINIGSGLARRPLHNLRLDQRQSVTNQSHPRNLTGQVSAHSHQPNRDLCRSFCG